MGKIKQIDEKELIKDMHSKTEYYCNLYPEMQQYNLQRLVVAVFQLAVADMKYRKQYEEEAQEFLLNKSREEDRHYLLDCAGLDMETLKNFIINQENK